MKNLQSSTLAAPEASSSRSLTLVEAVREALREEMERDERVVVLGEDVGALGGVFRATDGLLAQFGPERVVDTPMMELGIAGLAVGMAVRGLRPVAEIQFADFMHAAADHIISDAARMRFRTNGDAACPLVIRTAYGGGLRGGPYHSQSVEAYYSHVPGLRVVAASFPVDAKGLLTAAIRHPDPVLFLEHKRTYRAIRGEVPRGELVLPLDRANVVRGGEHVTVVSWGWVLHECLAAAEHLATQGILVEVIDPRALNPLDAETILESVRRTGRLCVVHEDTRTMGLGAELAALAAEFALDHLRAPVERLAMPDVAGIPASGPMEDFLLPDQARIAAALRTLTATDRPSRVNGRGFPRQPDAGLASDTPRTAQVWADALLTSATQVPQASSVVEVDLTRVARRIDEVREAWLQRGVEPGFAPFLAAALLAAIRRVPQTNAEFDAEAPGIRRHVGVHLGLSQASRDGTHSCHGVVRDADTLNVLGLALEMHKLRALSGPETGPETLLGSTICFAEYGPSSALFAVPLVLPGQVAAVRVGAVEERLVVREHGFALAPTAFVCASIDHRALDGMDAGALLGALKMALEGDEH